MAIIKNFLYDGLTYTITTGVAPVVINNEIIRPKVSLPFTRWDINFGLVKHDLANFIQNMIFTDINNLYLSTAVRPSVKLFKITGGTEDFYTYRYTYEETYYGSNFYDVTNRRLLFTTDGSYDYITDGDLKIPIASIGSFVLGLYRMPHYVHYTEGAFKTKHTTTGVFEVSCQFTEFFNPTNASVITGGGETITYVGGSDASDSGVL